MSEKDPKLAPASRLAARILRTRAIVRAPIALYRAGFGFLFGHRLLLLEHLGRRSGERRYVVLEVVGQTESGYVVASGFGKRAQWYRNLSADPRARIRIGWSGFLPAQARMLSRDEAAAALQSYADQHPGAWKRLRPVFEETLDADITDDGTTLPMVALEPPGLA